MSFQLRVRLVHRQHQHAKQPPKEESSEPTLNQPLSLEQSSMNCIITNLECYSSDLLTLLPLHFRRELLFLLPPADIFQLEHTNVVEGIDMENEIWKEVCGHYNFNITGKAHYGGTVPQRSLMLHRILPLPTGISLGVLNSASWKEVFISCLVSLLLCTEPFQLSKDRAVMCDRYSRRFGWKNYVVFLQMLFCNQFFKLNLLTEAGRFPLQISDVTLLPCRYSQFFTSLVSLSDWVQFLQDKCHIQPPHSITLDLEQVNMSTESASMLHHFLSVTKNLELFMSFKEPGDTNQPLTMEDRVKKTVSLCSMLSSSHQLETLNITQHVPYVRRGCLVRRTTDQYQFNKVLQTCFLHPSFAEGSISGYESFQGLKRIRIASSTTEIELSTLCSLLILAQNKTVESISVSGLMIRCDSHQREIVSHALKQSFTSPITPTCILISLTDMRRLPFFFLFWLIRRFLYSPSTALQKMLISSCQITYLHTVIPLEEALGLVKFPNLDSSHKSLSLSKLTLEPVFVEEISRLPSLVLDELCIQFAALDLRFHGRDSDCVNAELLGTLFVALSAIPVCHIKSLSIQFNMSGAWRLMRGESLPSLAYYYSNLLGTLFQTAQKLPETAVSLQCTLGSKYTELLLCSLHSEWKKHGGNVKLNQLFIFLSDSVANIPEFRSSVEASMMVYPIHEITKSINIKDKKNQLDVLELRTE